mmetsp:Transcript_150075/g.482363  ORF Transcript_150075/g.482363 Transcript_150075/m.482363 type:complete len:148 (+) Transcript_150075:983-1426(+)
MKLLRVAVSGIVNSACVHVRCVWLMRIDYSLPCPCLRSHLDIGQLCLLSDIGCRAMRCGAAHSLAHRPWQHRDSSSSLAADQARVVSRVMASVSLEAFSGTMEITSRRSIRKQTELVRPLLLDDHHCVVRVGCTMELHLGLDLRSRF